ncbi:MAG: hypothetical protein HQ595_03020, partial [Candidatus Omnitrophica bacterium]|nr:hypothetical protein [Candidatus Omnitrophota bacterium]
MPAAAADPASAIPPAKGKGLDTFSLNNLNFLPRHNTRLAHLPYFLWKQFKYKLKEANNAQRISEDAYDRIVIQCFGISRRDSDGFIKIEYDAIPYFVEVLNNPVNRSGLPVTANDVERYLRFHENLHNLIWTNRKTQQQISCLLTQLQTQALYNDLPIKDFNQLKEYFVNNYGKEYNNKNFVEELVVTYLVEKAFFSQPVRLVTDPEANARDRKEGRIDLPQEIIDKIEEMVSIQEFTILPDRNRITRLVPDAYFDLKDNLEKVRTKLAKEIRQHELQVLFGRAGRARDEVITDTEEKVVILNAAIDSICVIGGLVRSVFNGSVTFDIDLYLPDKLSDLAPHISQELQLLMVREVGFVTDVDCEKSNEFSINRVVIDVHTNKVRELTEGAIDDLLNMRLRFIRKQKLGELSKRAIRFSNEGYKPVPGFPWIYEINKKRPGAFLLGIFPFPLLLLGGQSLAILALVLALGLHLIWPQSSGQGESILTASLSLLMTITLRNRMSLKREREKIFRLVNQLDFDDQALAQAENNAAMLGELTKLAANCWLNGLDQRQRLDLARAAARAIHCRKEHRKLIYPAARRFFRSIPGQLENEPRDERERSKAILSAVKFYKERVSGACPILTPLGEVKYGVLARVETRMAKRKDAADRMICSVFRYVYSSAWPLRKWLCWSKLEMSDLLAAASTKITEHILEWDPTRGYRLCTYLGWKAYRGMRKELRECSRTVRIPTWLQDEIGRFVELCEQLQQQKAQQGGSVNLNPTDCTVDSTTIAAALGGEFSIKRVNHLRAIMELTLSLDAAGEEGKATLVNFVAASPEGQIQFNSLIAALLTQARPRVSQLWKPNLCQRNMRILDLRVLPQLQGVPRHKIMSRRKVGELCGGLNWEMVRRVEEQIWDVLRQVAIEMGLAPGRFIKAHQQNRQAQENKSPLSKESEDRWRERLRP